LLVVAALGGNALLRRGESPGSTIQEGHVREAVNALAGLVGQGADLVLTHGNGPQVGLLALESAADTALTAPYPFDVLGAETQGMIGYWLVRALRNRFPRRRAVARRSSIFDADQIRGGTLRRRRSAPIGEAARLARAR